MNLVLYIVIFIMSFMFMYYRFQNIRSAYDIALNCLWAVGICMIAYGVNCVLNESILYIGRHVTIIIK